MQVGGGYVPAEFVMFDVPLAERPGRVVEVVKTLKAAFRGQPFEYRGRQVHITPPPFRPGGPPVLLAVEQPSRCSTGARTADGFVPIDPNVWDAFRDEVKRLGRPDPDPARSGFPRSSRWPRTPTKDGTTWAQSFLHEMNAYGAWQAQANVSTPDRGYQM